MEITQVARVFTTQRTAEIVGVTYRQLDYWARTDLVKPSLVAASGSGSRRRYSYSDLLELKVIKNLLDNGIRLEQIRKIFLYLREDLGTDVSTAQLVISGANSVVVHTGDEIIELLKNGQTALNVLSLAGVKEQVDAAIVELFPEPEIELFPEFESELDSDSDSDERQQAVGQL